jgi:alkylhydroperoxidase family enzyme
MSESATHAAIEAIARNSYGRLVAYIAARSRDVAGAEDALEDAIAAALERWPRDGVPQKPEAWLLHAARNRVIDAARRHQVRQNAETFLRQIAEEAQAVANGHDPFPDERLKLLFFCAHPAIDPTARTPLCCRQTSARLPAAFGLFYAKVNKLDQKLTLPPELVMLIRHQVARINICLFCIDIARAFTIKASMNQAKFDALDQYTVSPLFTNAERAALDYVTELTKDKQVSPDTFSRMARHYSEREICEIVWLVASEHLYNMTNIGLNIHSDMLCDITKKARSTV